MKAAEKMMMTLAAVCLLMAVLGAPSDLRAPATCRAHAACVLSRVDCSVAMCCTLF